MYYIKKGNNFNARDITGKKIGQYSFEADRNLQLPEIHFETHLGVDVKLKYLFGL